MRKHLKKSADYPFSDAVLVDDRVLYTSGRIGLLPGTEKVPETAAEEARLVLEDLASVLRSASMTMDQLVQVQIFCTDISLWTTFNAVYREYFKGELPARAFIGATKLLFGARFELIGIAEKST